jgi:uncharacterized protein (TIGR02453 family)
MEAVCISKTTLKFLKTLKQNNNREWFEQHKPEFKVEQALCKNFFGQVLLKLKSHDDIIDLKVFRIYRDVRFSHDKTPYKTHIACSFKRAKPNLRGGYYLHIEPGNSFLACGFWAPEKKDINRVRKEFEVDAFELREIIDASDFKLHFGQLKGDELKTAPRGFDKTHRNIDLIRKKQWIVTKEFTDSQVLAESFLTEIDGAFQSIRPFFDYMSEVLTTDLNGESLL